MNKIYRIIWNSALNAWVVVSELTRNHTKRASATVATAVLATLLSAAAQASTGASDYDTPSVEFDPNNPTFDDNFEDTDNNVPGYKFGLLVVDKDGNLKDTDFANANDDDQGKRMISVEESESSTGKAKLKSSYLYLRENGGIEIDQEGRSAKFKVKAGDGLKIDDATDKLVADTVNLTVTNGKVSTPKNGDNKKLVNADNLATTLNGLGWQLKTTNGTAAAGTNATSTVQSGDEVEFKGEGVEVTTTSTGTKHTVTIKAAQTKGANKGGSWKIIADKEDGGELDPANTTPTEQEVKTGEKVTLKAGDNLKIKQNGKDFTYSLKKELKDLTSVEFKDANGGTDSASTKIDKDGLTITPTNGAATGTTTPNAISVTTSGISAGSKEITNVKSALSKYNSSNNDAKKDLVDLSSLTNTATGGTTTNNGLANKAATVGDLAGLGWVLSSTKTTDEAADKPFHAAVKNANEVEFKGKGAATVSAKTDSNGKHTVTVDVKEVEAGNGLEKDTANGKIKLKVKAKDGEENLLTVGADGVSVTKGEFNAVTTDATAADANTNNRGKVTVKASANGTPNDTDNKKVATVGDVAKAINDAATFVKVESTTDDIEDGTANGNTADDQALKAGDTLTFKAGKNLKAKLNKGDKSVTFALAKSIETDSATLSEKLSIGKGTNKVDIISDTNGLKLSKGTNGDTAVHLNGLASTLPDVTTNTGSSTSVTFSPSEIEKTRAATLKDVLEH
ncbi:ESPR-type extended signal peptide-containing protein [Neisseria lactamica]|uniref:ESPR-type extended signal peptide-containing protein n=1 Tax=Neisseria lactamica TaxID=486 RepID=UPI0023AAB51B|nr:ESPR-type extended signal peptide-containing protein [Neisseria lactamica]